MRKPGGGNRNWIVCPRKWNEDATNCNRSRLERITRGPLAALAGEQPRWLWPCGLLPAVCRCDSPGLVGLAVATGRSNEVMRSRQAADCYLSFTGSNPVAPLHQPQSLCHGWPGAARGSPRREGEYIFHRFIFPGSSSSGSSACIVPKYTPGIFECGSVLPRRCRDCLCRATWHQINAASRQFWSHQYGFRLRSVALGGRMVL